MHIIYEVEVRICGTFKKGDVVARKSYNKDVLFIIDRIIYDIAILKGITIRVEADAPITDLEHVEKDRIKEEYKKLDLILEKRPDHRYLNMVKTGKILHLDGDRKYTEKSYKFYKKMGLEAVVRNVSEFKQPQIIYRMLEKYSPDILVVTGHDGMIRKKSDYNNICNYRNSKYFIKAVKEARKWDMKNELVIFAGACQSFYEELIYSGANFASSPARILIDFADPLIIAEKVAITDSDRYIKIEDIEKELRDGRRGVNGIGANGKKRIIYM